MGFKEDGLISFNIIGDNVGQIEDWLVDYNFMESLNASNDVETTSSSSQESVEVEGELEHVVLASPSSGSAFSSCLCYKPHILRQLHGKNEGMLFTGLHAPILERNNKIVSLGCVKLLIEAINYNAADSSTGESRGNGETLFLLVDFDAPIFGVWAKK
ncbi:hypothetical protein SUGI_1133840 [Cryptomeria japonica]|nr:hypothetical protein SUGI_1133840 [Cryptomeria japonica]